MSSTPDTQSDLEFRQITTQSKPAAVGCGFYMSPRTPPDSPIFPTNLDTRARLVEKSSLIQDEVGEKANAHQTGVDVKLGRLEKKLGGKCNTKLKSLRKKLRAQFNTGLDKLGEQFYQNFEILRTEFHDEVERLDCRTGELALHHEQVSDGLDSQMDDVWEQMKDLKAQLKDLVQNQRVLADALLACERNEEHCAQLDEGARVLAD